MNLGSKMKATSANTVKFKELYRCIKNTKLSGIFLAKEDNKKFTRNQLIYLAGLIDNNGSISICINNPIEDTKGNYLHIRFINTSLSLPNRSIEFTKWLGERLLYNYNMKREEVDINGPRVYLILKDLFPFLINKKLSARYIFQYAIIRQWDKLNWKNFDYNLKIPKTNSRLAEEIKILLDLRYSNKEGRGRSNKEDFEILEKLKKYYSELAEGKKYNYIPTKIKEDLSSIFKTSSSNENFNNDQLLYLAGQIDSDVSSIFFVRQYYRYIPKIKINNRNLRFKKFIARKTNQTVSQNNLILNDRNTIKLLKQLHHYLIIQKNKARYVLDWANNFYNDRKRIDIVREFKKKYSYKKGMGKKSLEKFKLYYEETTGNVF